jgi:hypothetical protein
MSKRLHVKYALFLSDFNVIRIFSTGFWKKSQIPSFIKIRPVGADLFHAERGTDGCEANSRFLQFWERA